MELDSIEFRLQERLGTTLNALTFRAYQKELELICEIGPDVPEQLIGDPARLRQVLINLIGNAIKFTEVGEIVVCVEREHVPAEEESVLLHFSVTDTGIGISPEKQETVFNAFEQADGSTTRYFGGTGLGLAISSQIVDLMGGTIWVESEPGVGSTFHFTVRFGASSNQPTEAVQPSIEQLEGRPVLIVDDNATSRRVLKDLGGNWQLKPMLAADVSQALAMAKQTAPLDGKPLLVLADCRMCGENGIPLAETFAADPDLTGIKIVLLSSAAESDIAARCRTENVVACVKKPVMPSELLAAIFAATSLTESHTASDQAPDSTSEVLSGASAQPAEHPISGLNVLLAEDNRINQKVIVHLLEQDQHRVTIAATGKQAVEEFDRHAFDLVLMDVQMPEMDGYEAAAMIQQMQDGGGRHVPIVAVTAHALKGDQQRCLDAGMDAYLAKPIRLRELRSMIATVLPDRISAPVLDWDVALENVNDNMDFLQQLVAMFLEDFEQNLDDIRVGIESQVPEQVQRSTHRLKGTFLPFFATAAIEAAQSLEDIGRSKNLTGASTAFQTLEDEVAKLVDELTSWHSQTVPAAEASPEYNI